MENQENVTVETQEVESTTTSANTQEKTYTQKEMDSFISKKFNEWSEKQQKKQDQADKLRGLSDEQRKYAEMEMKLKEYEEQLQSATLEKNRASATQVMAERGLPTMFVDYCVSDNAEDMLAKITQFEKSFKSAVNDAVSKKIGGNTPKQGMVSQVGMTREQFSKMPLSEQSNLYNTNPTLYKQMIGR